MALTPDRGFPVIFGHAVPADAERGSGKAIQLRVFVHAVAARKGKEGGATLLIHETARALVEAAPHHEYVFCLDASLEIDLPEEVRRIDAPLKNAYERLKWDNHSYSEILVREGADISLALLGYGAMRPPVPRVCMLPDSTYFCRFAGFNRSLTARALIRARAQLLRRVAMSSAVLVVPSQAMADGVAADYGLRVPIKLLRYGSDAEHVEPSAKPWDEPVRILYVSQLQPHKAHINLVPLARALEDMDLDFEITICANPADNPRLAAQLKDAMRTRGISGRFRNLADLPRSDLDRLFGESDCFVYPSLCESFGFPMIEATSAGMPVVAAGTAINREMLGPGAFYFPPLEPEAGAEKIRQLADNGLERAEMVVQAQRHQERILPSWKQYGEELVEIIEAAASH
ncbi:MAG: hypothetical protein DCC49_03490 [Acidobacteria bacterium]|nr:MAG: hypothetical protein DCC49_03490 [Acidobacteriota bacterium]